MAAALAICFSYLGFITNLDGSFLVECFYRDSAREFLILGRSIGFDEKLDTVSFILVDEKAFYGCYGIGLLASLFTLFASPFLFKKV